MNLLDEQIPEDQRRLLRSWHVPVRQVGYDIGRKGIKDPEIIPSLHVFDKALSANIPAAARATALNNKGSALLRLGRAVEASRVLRRLFSLIRSLRRRRKTYNG